MFFWLMLIIGFALAALHLTGGGEAGPADHQLTYLTIFGIGMVIAGALKLLLQLGANGLRHAFSWVSVVGLIFLGIVYRAEIGDLFIRATSDRMASVAVSQVGEEAELRRAWDGHYRADAVVDGLPMRLLIDTGASMVLLPYESVEGMGIDPETLDYSQAVTTANGRSTVAPITIASIRIGDIEVRDVAAAVAHPGRLQTGLLGMSFLDKIDETVFQGDRLVLRQNGPGARDSRFKRVPGTVNGMFTPEALKDQPKPY